MRHAAPAKAHPVSLRKAMLHTTLRSVHSAHTWRGQDHCIATTLKGQIMKIQPRPARLYLAGLSLALAGAFATAVQAAPPGPGGPAGPGMMGPGMMMAHGPMGGPGGHAGYGGYGGYGSGMFEGMMTRMLDRVNATPEQRTQIQQIMQTQANEMRAQGETGRALRQQAMALFAQPTVDAKAVEALRQQQLALHDANSKRMTAAMLEISRVLTPEQRKQMADTMNQRSEMMQRHLRERQAADAPKS
jgi:Spy/CpxP family protein refolding chaperone